MLLLYRLYRECETIVSPTDKGLTIIPTAWQTLFHRTHWNRRLKRHYPADFNPLVSSLSAGDCLVHRL